MVESKSRSFVEGQARFSRISSENVLLHFRVPKHGDVTRLHAHLINSPTIRVIVTASDSTARLTADALRASAFEFLPKYLGERSIAESLDEIEVLRGQSNLPSRSLIGKTLSDIEKIVVEETISESGGSISKAARVLGVSPSTIYRKLESWRAVKPKI